MLCTGESIKKILSHDKDKFLTKSQNIEHSLCMIWRAWGVFTWKMEKSMRDPFDCEDLRLDSCCFQLLMVC